jgi:hypothetical protein
MTLSVRIKRRYAECHIFLLKKYTGCHNAECHYAECHYAESIMLSVVMLCVIEPLDYPSNGFN